MPHDRIALLGDVHGNLEALEQVLHDARQRGCTSVVQVGDIVGYGPDPGPCLARLHEEGALCVAGNHEWAVLRKLDIKHFNPLAKRATAWTRARLTHAERSLLAQLPLLRWHDSDLTVVHATAVQPELFPYVTHTDEAESFFGACTTRHAVYGHSHVPGVFLQGEQLRHWSGTETLEVGSRRALFNVGSVGQPRDGDWRAAWAEWQPGAGLYTLHRIGYDLDSTIAKIYDRGLPIALGERLRVGQ